MRTLKMISSFMNILALGSMMAFGLLLAAPAAAKPTDLAQQFAVPPASAQAHTFWFWLCPTTDTLTRDLESLKKQGVNGYVLMNLGDSSVWVDAPGFMSKEWHGLFQHAMKETNRLGMEAVIHNCDGFQEAGGPWNPPENAMKEVVWNRITVQGGNPYRGMVPRPPAKMGFYRDIAMFAYPARGPAQSRMAQAEPRITLNRPTNQYAIWWQGNTEILPPVLDSDGPAGREMMDGNPNTALALSATDDKTSVTITLDFAKPYPCSSLYIYPWRRTNIAVREGLIQAWDDGSGVFRTVSFFTNPNPDNLAPLTFSFPETSAKAYRLLLRGQTETIVVSEIELLGKGETPSWNPKVPWLEAKAGASKWPDDPLNSPLAQATEKETIRKDELIDLRSKVDHLGRLDWTPPQGTWTILRLGYTLTGAENHPASPAGIGWECDKMDRKAVEAHLDGWIGKMAGEQKALLGKAWSSIHADSWECGNQNWTAAFPEEFARLRGYDLRPYLPVLAGEVVGSAEASERFLQDFRQTIADLIADNFYGAFRDWAHRHNLTFEAEAMGPGVLHYPPVDHLQVKGRTDLPMGEFHEFRESSHDSPRTPDDMCRDNKEAASAAHIYGKRLAGAEAFTGLGNWTQDPYWLKDLGDLAFCVGINRFVLHCSFQQADDRKPGWVYPPFWGMNFHRNNTWWGEAHGWLEYINRCQYLLQQGRFVGDVAVYTGEMMPSFAPVEGDPGKAIEKRLPAELRGAPAWDFDWCNTEVLLTRMSVREDGRLALPDGVAYRLLALPDSDVMSPAVLKKIRDLVADGATVLGPKPEKAPGLANYPNCDEEVRKLAAELWGDCDGKAITEHRFGKGRIVWGKPLATVMDDMDVRRDFEPRSVHKDTCLRYIHKTIEGAEVYFVSNQKDRPEEVECLFRVRGKVPELWHPDTGQIEYPAVYEMKDGRTHLPLRFDPKGSIFVIFRERANRASVVAVERKGERILPRAGGSPAETPVVEIAAQQGGVKLRAWEAGVYELKTSSGRTVKTEVADIPAPLELIGAWDVSFPPNLGAPAKANFEKLASWADSAEEGIKYFSGTATYTKEFEIPGELIGQDRELYLDLGKVRNLATVRLNGQDLGLLWKPPFRVELGRLVKPGKNRLEVQVTNMWVNRLIGDEALPKDQRHTWTNLHYFYKANSPLLESGLLGPVLIRTAVKREVGM